MLHDKEESFLKMTELHEIKEKMRHTGFALKMSIFQQDRLTRNITGIV